MLSDMPSERETVGQLRRRLRKKRQGLSAVEQRRAAAAVCQLAMSNEHFRASARLAFYCENDGEVATRPLMDLASKQGKQCFLPVILDSDELSFVEYKKDQALHAGRYGILQSVGSELFIEPRELDCVFVPLVGFDTAGNRMGMGKGYYDRAFAFKSESKSTKPVLLGLAHECQKVTSGALGLNAWDVPLDVIITDKEIYAAERQQ